MNQNFKCKLATIERISRLLPMQRYDYIQAAILNIYSADRERLVVVPKGLFQIGDLCVYLHPGAIVPDLPRYEAIKLKGSPPVRKVKPKKFRPAFNKNTVVSEGIAYHLSVFPELTNVKEGDDVSDILGVTGIGDLFLYGKISLDGIYGRIWLDGCS